MRCVLCGGELEAEQLRDFHTRDFRDQRIVVKICVDAAACVDRTMARRRLTTAEKRRAIAAR